MQPERITVEPKRVSKRAEVIPINSTSGMVWRGPDYPLLAPGKYIARGVKTQGPEWVRSFQRWSLRVEFALVDEPGFVSAFFNLGNDKGAKQIGRQSRYFKAWTIANGGPPCRGELMDPAIFLEGQFFEVQVVRCDADSKGRAKNDSEVYSVVSELLKSWHP